MFDNSALEGSSNKLSVAVGPIKIGPRDMQLSRICTGSTVSTRLRRISFAPGRLEVPLQVGASITGGCVAVEPAP